MSYLPRKLESKIKEYLTLFSAVGVTGPRQSGKSTLLLSLLKNYTYVTFDDFKIIDFFYNDPEKFMQVYQNEVIFDEVQKVPEIFNYIKLAIDRDRNHYGKFILTGSSQFSFLKKVSESLAGRIGLLSLLPLQYSEIPVSLRDEAIIKGSYPELVLRDYRETSPWYSSYIDTYLNKDVRDLIHIGDMRDFQRFVNLLAANTAQMLNLSHYANDLGVSVQTIKRWLSVLEASYIVFLLPPFYSNIGSRLVKSPKIYFYDTGLVCYLTGIETKELYERGPMVGSIFENYVIAEIVKRELYEKSGADLSYLRTSHGVEVDLVIDRKNRKEWIEIKNTATFKPKMTAAIDQFKGEDDQGFLLYNGDQFPYVKNINVINYRDYL